MYNTGKGVATDPAEAVKWFRKAADQGFADAENNLGVMYNTGSGITKDPAEAVKWFRRAADQGSAGAQYNLGLEYEKGEGIPNDPVEGVKWFRKAADQGDGDGQYALGRAYAMGDGVAKDPAAAVRWFRKAADQGNAYAQYNLGVVYENGEGTPQDPAEAAKWFRKAAEGFKSIVDAHPDDAMLHLLLASLYEKIGDSEHAIQQYEKTVELDANLPLAKNNLANLLAAKGKNLDRALELAHDAKRAMPDDPGVSDTLGWVLYKRGEASAAVGYLREAESQSAPDAPNLNGIRLHLAKAYEANGESEKAQQTLTRALASMDAAQSKNSAPEPLEVEARLMLGRLKTHADTATIDR